MIIILYKTQKKIIKIEKGTMFCTHNAKNGEQQLFSQLYTVLQVGTYSTYTVDKYNADTTFTIKIGKNCSNKLKRNTQSRKHNLEKRKKKKEREPQKRKKYNDDFGKKTRSNELQYTEQQDSAARLRKKKTIVRLYFVIRNDFSPVGIIQ